MPRVLIVGRTAGGYEGMIAEGFRSIGFSVAIHGYEAYLKPGSWLAGVALRRLLVNPRLREHVIDSLRGLRRFNRDLVRLVERLRPDIAYIVKGEALSANTLRFLINALGEEHIGYFNPDDPRYAGVTSIYADNGVRLFTACEPCLYEMRRRYGEAVFLPFAAPLLARRIRGRCGRMRPAVLFIGTMYPERLRAVRRLLENNVPLYLAGPGWGLVVPGVTGGIYGRRYVAITRLFRVVLNIHVSSDIGVKANMRVFEIPGFGGVELSDNPAVVEKYLRPGEEVFTYSGLEDLVDKTRELLSMDSEELCSVARRGLERVKREHLYSHRAMVIAKTLGAL